MKNNIDRIRQDPPEVLTVVEASIYLNISDRMIRKLCKEDLLPHYRVGNLIRIKLQDLRDYGQGDQS